MTPAATTDIHTLTTVELLDRGQGDWFSGIYRDGCELADSCFRCPLDRCRYEMQSGVARAQIGREQLRRRLANGETVEQAVRSLGVSRRTAYRWLGRR
jgi:hypothetical protein